MLYKAAIESNSTFHFQINANFTLSLTLWTEETLGNPNLGINIDIPFGEEDVYGFLEFYVDVEDLGLQNTSGIFYIKIKYNEDSEDDYVIANWNLFYECMMQRVLKMEIDGCGEAKKESECRECNDDCGDICYIVSLLFSLPTFMALGNTSYVNNIVTTIKDYCEDCSNCPKFSTAFLSEYVINYENPYIPKDGISPK